MNRINKKKLVDIYSKLFDRYEAIFLLKNSGLTVFDSRSIRLQFKKIDSKFMVVKNSLAKIALNQTQFLGMSSLFFGPISVVYSNNPVLSSKLLVKICKDNDCLDLIGGALLDKQLSKEDVVILSRMPTESEIRAKIITLVNAVSRKVLWILNEPKTKLSRVFKSYAKKY